MKDRKHLLFVSYELYPINAGGCGSFIWNALLELLPADDYEISLLLDMPANECELFRKKYQPQLQNGHLLKIYCLSEVLPNEDISLEDFNNVFLWKSYRFYRGLLKIHESHALDYVEFFDYVGIGYFSVRAKKYEGKLSGTLLGIRGHCTIDLMDAEQVQSDFSFEKLIMYEMEKAALQAADIVFVQTNSWKEFYSNRYGIPIENIQVSPPPIQLKDLPRCEQLSDQPNVLFYGRLFQLKGVDTFVDAAVEYLSLHPESITNFYLAGYDGKSSAGESYEGYLRQRIPKAFQERFIFTGQVDREQLSKLISMVQVAVFPNYIESFCYSIHELYYSGLPIICRPIPAFLEYFSNGQNCLLFDGTVHDLAEKIELILQDENLRKKLSYPYPVVDEKPFENSYRKLFSVKPILNDGAAVVSAPISVILLEDSGDEDKTESTIKSLNNDCVSFERSYLLSRQFKGQQGVPIWFLGEKWYVYNLNRQIPSLQALPLEQFVWIGKSGDQINRSYFGDACRILTIHKDLNYVSSYQLQNQSGQSKCFCCPYDLIAKYPYFFENELSRSVLRVPTNRSLKDLFDSRLGSFGELEMLRLNGYTMPNLFLHTQKKFIGINLFNRLAFAIHHASKDDEWKPSSLSPILLAMKLQEYVREPLQLNTRISWKRKLVVRMNQYLDKKTGFTGKIQRKLFNWMISTAKKWIRQ